MLIGNGTVRTNSDHAQVSQTLHRHSRRSIGTIKTVGTVTGSGSNSSNNQKLISRNTRKSPSKLFTLQLHETGNEQEK